MHSDDTPATWVIHCDGSALPNPGRMGLGAMVHAPDGSVVQELSEATTFTGCNNEAELRALALALRWLQAHGTTAEDSVCVFSDNSVLVEQLAPGGHRAAPIVRLAPLVDEVRGLMHALGRVAVRWIPRHRNGPADALARSALGLAPKPAMTHSAHTRKKRR
jgi:ribonuclease HI